MKKLNIFPFQNRPTLLLFVFAVSLLTRQLAAQEGKKIVKLHYVNSNNRVQYLLLECVLKKGKVLTPISNQSYKIYLDSAGTNLISNLTTDETGKAKAFIPPSLKAVWDASSQHTFIVMSDDEEVISDFVITKAKITLDTSGADGVRNLTASVMKMENNKWIPAADVEMKVGVQRLGGILSAGEEDNYTTDSSGTLIVEFKRDKLPGDQKGNLLLVAKVEDNELFGSLIAEKKALWGVATKVDTAFFDQRTLWSTRFRTPYWLLFMAYSIIFGVWGTLIYLIRQVIKIKKLGA
ncbi:hypothetical protein [Runella sp.]|uniref:hypothetical protein n=1 Tax=Runella sp. TaxID=1960881 RepID=UPI0026209CA7|nr:hypothetical protein [Runella sp.]